MLWESPDSREDPVEINAILCGRQKGGARRLIGYECGDGAELLNDAEDHRTFHYTKVGDSGRNFFI